MAEATKIELEHKSSDKTISVKKQPINGDDKTFIKEKINLHISELESLTGAVGKLNESMDSKLKLENSEKLDMFDHISDLAICRKQSWKALTKIMLKTVEKYEILNKQSRFEHQIENTSLDDELEKKATELKLAIEESKQSTITATAFTKTLKEEVDIFNEKQKKKKLLAKVMQHPHIQTIMNLSYDYDDELIFESN